ncbi:DUF397 domain-containing protein [Actinomadura sp. NPDC047616]|uniref:DUF397 domain-containing protein n=1 Tax=Actinomadura sp. NPDC047616 TaxID=3155914 RepID=UPI0033F125DE
MEEVWGSNPHSSTRSEGRCGRSSLLPHRLSSFLPGGDPPEPPGCDSRWTLAACGWCGQPRSRLFGPGAGVVAARCFPIGSRRFSRGATPRSPPAAARVGRSPRVAGVVSRVPGCSDLGPVWSRQAGSTGPRGNGGLCVEAARVAPAVAVRHSKDPDGPMLMFDAGAWAAFAQSVKSSTHDLV